MRDGAPLLILWIETFCLNRVIPKACNGFALGEDDDESNGVDHKQSDDEGVEANLAGFFRRDLRQGQTNRYFSEAITHD